MIRRRRNRLADDRGSELIELAIVLPILGLLFLLLVIFWLIRRRRRRDEMPAWW